MVGRSLPLLSSFILQWLRFMQVQIRTTVAELTTDNLGSRRQGVALTHVSPLGPVDAVIVVNLYRASH